jgi:hypothetical protein
MFFYLYHFLSSKQVLYKKQEVGGEEKCKEKQYLELHKMDVVATAKVVAVKIRFLIHF